MTILKEKDKGDRCEIIKKNTCQKKNVRRS